MPLEASKAMCAPDEFCAADASLVKSSETKSASSKMCSNRCFLGPESNLTMMAIT